MFSGALKVLDKKCYRGESVQSDRVRNEEQRSLQSNRAQNKGQKSPQHKMQNIQCNRSTVCFAITVSFGFYYSISIRDTNIYIFSSACYICSNWTIWVVII
ncbi:hypothetical protein Wcon_01848 [Wolbachia endosymbiont of Cylisticus convexus]|nr:hypothetical protein Wcon_01848 [Wolbachia endosymbiont of Cylisticus convexus]